MPRALSDVLTPQQRAAVRELAARHGVKHVRVFGSYGRGEARPGSDLDLLVDMEYGRGVAMRLVDFVLEVESLLGMKVDVLSARALDPKRHAQILREARAL